MVNEANGMEKMRTRWWSRGLFKLLVPGSPLTAIAAFLGLLLCVAGEKATIA